MSHRIAPRSGSSVCGRSPSASVSAVGADTVRSMRAMSPRLVRLAAIATAAGAFSALFGVGGGAIIVPLLMLWLGHREREATGTALAAIVLIAAIAAAAHGLYGNVHPLEAALVAAPAVAGVVLGTAVQQRISERAVAGIFALLLIGSAAVLVL
jgi:uncharacterized membrane protein YfcA